MGKVYVVCAAKGWAQAGPDLKYNLHLVLDNPLFQNYPDHHLVLLYTKRLEHVPLFVPFCVFVTQSYATAYCVMSEYNKRVREDFKSSFTSHLCDINPCPYFKRKQETMK